MDKENKRIVKVSISADLDVSTSGTDKELKEELNTYLREFAFEVCNVTDIFNIKQLKYLSIEIS